MSRYPRVILSEEEQRQIRERARNGEYYRDIGVDLHISPRIVAAVLDGSYTPPDPVRMLDRRRAKKPLACESTNCKENQARLKYRLSATSRAYSQLRKRYAKMVAKGDNDLLAELEFIKRRIENVLAVRKPK